MSELLICANPGSVRFTMASIMWNFTLNNGMALSSKSLIVLLSNMTLVAATALDFVCNLNNQAVVCGVSPRYLYALNALRGSALRYVLSHNLCCERIFSTFPVGLSLFAVMGCDKKSFTFLWQ